MSSSHGVCKSLELVRCQLSSRLPLLAKSALVCFQTLTFLPLNISLRLSCRDCYISGIYIPSHISSTVSLSPRHLNASIIYLAPRACLRLGISRLGSSSSRTSWNPPVIPTFIFLHHGTLQKLHRPCPGRRLACENIRPPRHRHRSGESGVREYSRPCEEHSG